MAFHKRKKNSRQKGHTTHGWGAMKKHRGAGNRGGRGNAGSGKRGDALKPSLWKDTRYFGTNGFASRFTKINAINIEDIDDNAESWAKRGLIENKAGTFVIDLKKMGYDKLLATGQAKKKLEISVDYATEGAIEKVKKAGGAVKLLAEPKKKKEKPSKEAKEARPEASSKAKKAKPEEKPSKKKAEEQEEAEDEQDQ